MCADVFEVCFWFAPEKAQMSHALSRLHEIITMPEDGKVRDSIHLQLFLESPRHRQAELLPQRTTFSGTCSSSGHESFSLRTYHEKILRHTLGDPFQLSRVWRHLMQARAVSRLHVVPCEIHCLTLNRLFIRISGSKAPNGHHSTASN